MAHRSVVGLLVVLMVSGSAVTVVRLSTPAADDRAPAQATPSGEPSRDDQVDGGPGSAEDSDFTLAFAGDVHFEAHLRELLDEPNDALSQVEPLLSGADLAMLNLETAITERGSPEPKDYTFRASAAALDALAAAGVDVVSLANNHGMDFGDRGFRDTLAARAEATVAMIGIGRNAAEAFAPYFRTIDGTRVALLAATVVPEPTTEAWAAANYRGGLATAVDPQRLLTTVGDAKARADLVIVYMHWGEERVSCPTAEQRRLQSQLAAAGADVVLGAHAHVQLGSGWATDGTYVNYGLGNFVWYHGRTEAVAATGVLTLTVRGGEVVEHSWAPARIPQDGGVAVPLTGAEARAARAEWDDLRRCAELEARP